jgi:hypothetical protein
VAKEGEINKAACRGQLSHVPCSTIKIEPRYSSRGHQGLGCDISLSYDASCAYQNAKSTQI